jgi:hypothetical protein
MVSDWPVDHSAESHERLIRSVAESRTVSWWHDIPSRLLGGCVDVLPGLSSVLVQSPAIVKGIGRRFRVALEFLQSLSLEDSPS